MRPIPSVEDQKTKGYVVCGPIVKYCADICSAIIKTGGGNWLS